MKLPIESFNENEIVKSAKDNMDETYYDNLSADQTGVVLGIPPWLKALGFTDDITGLYAMVDLEDLFKHSKARDHVCHIYKYGLMQLVGMKPSGLHSVVSYLTSTRFYRFVKNGKAKMKIMSFTPLMLADRSWSAQIMYRLFDTVHKGELSKLFIGLLSITPTSSQTTHIPEISSGTVISVDLTGDVEDIEMCERAGTHKLKCEVTTLQRLVGKPHSSSSDSGFFGRLWGTSKTAATTVVNKDLSDMTIEETLRRIGHTNKMIKESDTAEDDDLL